MKSLNRTQIIPGSLFFLLLIASACSDFIEIDPPKTEIVNETVFSSDASATAAIRGIYSLMMANPNFAAGGMEEYTGIAGDEFICYSIRNEPVQFFQNAVNPRNGDLFQYFWSEPYKQINNANSIIEAVERSAGMTAAGKRQIEGEARFVRAFCHFYIAALFGNIPYITTTSYQSNSKAEQLEFHDVLTRIETDLLGARELLSDDFSYSNNERIQPNRGAATAMLARLYLYLEQWDKAEAMSSELIDDPRYSLLTDLNGVFLANSNEAIWQLRPVVPGTNAPQGQLFIMTGAPNGFSRRVSITPGLMSAFETDDLRKQDWTATVTKTTGSWDYIHKYKVRLGETVTEYAMILRLAEQYLIRAEARVHLGDLEGAKADINVIRSRAGLPNTTASDEGTLLLAIEHERRIELCGEFGHRWLDMKRTGRLDAVMSAVKPDWQTTDEFFPIPDSEILLNPNLSQNAGY